jgi:EAL domain-containing protein (putative c-di-GMP-specific phosphodiesterase class I)
MGEQQGLATSPEVRAMLQRSLAVSEAQPPGEAASSELLLRHALRAMRSHFDMEVAFLSEFRAGQRVIQLVDAAPGGPLLQGRADPLEQTYCQRIVDGRLPAVLHDARRNAEAAGLSVTADLPVGAHLGVPIRFGDGALYGTFCCFRRQPDDSLNARDAATMRLFADFMAQVLEQQTAQERAASERAQRLARVLRERLLTIVYQPVFNLETNRLVAYEALSRFRAEPMQGPDVWFSDAAAAGVQSVLERAALQLALAGLAQIPPGVYLSLNVSPATLLEPDFASVFEGAPLSRLMLEVTEHSSVTDYAAVERQLAPLRAAGMRLAVDDAGAGFASFRHILQLRPDVIKLDASLIRHIDQRPDSRALASALIRFAQETGCRMVAEGVETAAELRVLRELAVDKAQGYLLGRPGPLPPFAEMASPPPHVKG